MIYLTVISCINPPYYRLTEILKGVFDRYLMHYPYWLLVDRFNDTFDS